MTEFPCINCGRLVAWESAPNGLRRLVERRERQKRHHVCEPLCGAWMPYVKERCARRAGHAPGHRRRTVMDDDAKARRGRWAA